MNICQVTGLANALVAREQFNIITDIVSSADIEEKVQSMCIWIHLKIQLIIFL